MERMEQLRSELRRLRGSEPDDVRRRHADRVSSGDVSRLNLCELELRGVCWCDVALPAVMLAGSNLQEAELGASSFVGGSFLLADLRGADLSKCRLDLADFRGADLRRARLHRASARWADFRGADVRGASLSSVCMDGARLQGALIGPLGGEEMDGALLDVTLWEATFDASTVARNGWGERELRWVGARGMRWVGAAEAAVDPSAWSAYLRGWDAQAARRRPGQVLGCDEAPF